MTRGFYNLTSAMLSQGRRLDVVANNMTNLTTPGYKQETYTDTTFEEVMLSRTGNKDKSGSQELGPASYILAPSELYVDYGQGGLEETGLPLDFAIKGDGFFAIETEDGIGYTRNGRFSIDEEGYLYLAGQGRVLSNNGTPIWLPNENIACDESGNLYTEGRAVFLGQLGVYTFADNNALAIGPTSLYDPNGQQPVAAEQQDIAWKSIENSNVDMLQEMSRMMTAQRALQSAAQILKLYDGVLTKATTEVGRL